MTSDNDHGHILYKKGDFSFISTQPEYTTISEEMKIILTKAYSLYVEHDMEKFFKKYPPPSEYKYMWWCPNQKGFVEWERVRLILDNQIFRPVDLPSADFDLVTRILSHLANKGWQAVIQDFGDILDIILENYTNYEVIYLT